MIGCYLRAKIQNRVISHQRPAWISVVLRHQYGIFGLELRLFSTGEELSSRTKISVYSS